mmetsp:Transcript_6656/g.12062  ORF Transcript_6656/g.12062 Transcript_6656/m.12062 type:complete len:254 (-) Transcript_6656:202-963(-)
MKPRSGRLAKLEQSSFTSSLSERARTTSEGPARSEVPVSTAAWHLLLQRCCGWSPTATSSISTCQYPGLDTGTQNISLAMRWALYSPKEISLSSRSSAAKNTENKFFFKTLSRIMQSKTLKCGACDICGRPNPKMPSNGTRLKGCSVSSVTAIKLPWVQMSPRQMWSFMNTPLISPVPKVMVTTSRSPFGLTSSSGASAKATLMAVREDELLKRRCILHASLAQAVDGMMRFPLPVSNTTSNSCGGVPSCKMP